MRPCDNAVYTVQQPDRGSDCKYNKYYLLNLSAGDKNNDIVVVN